MILSAKEAIKISSRVLTSALLIVSTSAYAQGNGNGNGNGNSGGNGVAADLTAIETEIDALQVETAAIQAELMELAESIADLGVNTVDADCSSDGAALQLAIDAAPAAGAIINISGLCDSANITGKANLLLDGGDINSGNGVAGDLTVNASRNIQLSGINAASMDFSNNASVFVGDLSVTGPVGVQLNSSMVQVGGTVNIGDQIFGSLGGQIVIDNGTLNNFALSRSASLILNANRPGGSSITLNGRLGVFSGSHFLAQGFSDSGGSVIINGNDGLVVQRTSAALFAGDTVQLNLPAQSSGAPAALIRQNSVLDVINMSEANFNVADISLTQGGGSRLFFFDGSTNFEASCDDSVWTNGFIACAE